MQNIKGIHPMISFVEKLITDGRADERTADGQTNGSESKSIGPTSKVGGSKNPVR